MRISTLMLKFGALILTVCFALLYLGYQVRGREGLFWALLFSIAWVFLLWQSSDQGWLQYFRDHFHAQPLKGQDAWGLLTKVELASRQLHRTAPDFYLVSANSSFIVSLSLGLSRDVILLSRNVLQNLAREEVEALLVAEVASLTLRRQFRFRLFDLFAKSIPKLGSWIDCILPWGRRLRLTERAFMPFAKILLHLSAWRHFEQERDEMTISVLHDRRSLASAIWKLHSLAQVHPLKIPGGLEHVFLTSPDRNDGDTHFLQFHSSISLRTRRILGADKL